MKTAVFASNEAIYVVSKSQKNKQNIFNIGGNIVFGRHSNKIILNLFKKFGHKKLSSKKIAKYAAKCLESGELYICGTNKKDFGIYKADKNGYSEIKNSISKSIVCKTVPYESLVNYVTRFIAEDYEDDQPQFGFVCRTSTKTLYGKDTELYLIPQEYSTEDGEFSEKRNQKNTLSYRKLKSHLETIISLEENKPAIHNWSNKKRLNRKENAIKCKTYEIINQYVTQQSGIKSVFVKKKGFSDRELGDLVNGDIEHLVISLRKPNALSDGDLYDKRHEHADNISRIYSGCTRVFKYAHSLVLAVEKKEAEHVKNEIGSSDLVVEIRKPYKVRIPKPIISPINIKHTGKLDMWNLDMIGVYDAWYKTKGEGARIGIIDTGIDYGHKNLKSRFDPKNPGFDFIRNNKKPFDENGHGTHVAGTAAGIYTGVAPRSMLYALRVLDKYGCGSEIDVILALEWAIDHRLDVVNMSIGFEYKSRALGDACEAAVRNGVLICAAAGNDPYESCFPGDYHFPGIISFAAIDKSCERPYWSRISENNDLSAPGVNIASSIPGDSYAYMSGTSMATPHGAGSSALIISFNRQDPKSIEDIMKEDAEKIGKKEYYGFGLVRPDLVLMAQRKKELMLALM